MKTWIKWSHKKTKDILIQKQKHILTNKFLRSFLCEISIKMLSTNSSWFLVKWTAISVQVLLNTRFIWNKLVTRLFATLFIYSLQIVHTNSLCCWHSVFFSLLHLQSLAHKCNCLNTYDQIWSEIDFMLDKRMKSGHINWCFPRKCGGMPSFALNLDQIG